MDTVLKICVAGASGQLGRAVLGQILPRQDMRLVGAMVSSGSPHLGADAGELAGLGFVGLETVVALEEASETADIVIDASAPRATAAIAERLAERGDCALVTGVTGLDADEQAVLEQASAQIPVLQASNFSLGVAVVEKLVAEAARALDARHFDLEIVEAHHRHKTDAPSGTALSLGAAAATARDRALDDVAVFDRPRQGPRRGIGAIGFSSVRGGGVIGEHAARFLSELEEVAVSHRAFDREIFARGAVQASAWIAGKPAGLYGMRDVIG